MYREKMKHGTNGLAKSSEVAPKLGSTKPAVTTLRSVVILAALAVLCLTGPAQAQTEFVINNFTGTPDGANPTGSVTFNGVNLFGTTYNGGAYGNGSVFELMPNGTGGWTETVLYSFCPAAPSCVDGANPAYANVIFDSAGNLYGTAFNGGQFGNGDVFELSPGADNTWTQKVLYSFANIPDGANPVNGLIMDKSGNIYGTTYAGGSAGGNGTVFEMTLSGDTWSETPIYDINSNDSGLVMNGAGHIFGTTYGSIFELTPNGAGGWNPTTLFTFNSADAATEGSDPTGTLVLDSSGDIFGTTASGGTNNAGTVFGMTVIKGVWIEKVLFSFGGNATYGPNGATPQGGVVLDSLGNLYGTTKAGGQKGAGIVYELAATKTKGAYKEHIVLNFNGENGAEPLSSLVLDSTGHLYGTTLLGGADGEGSVFVANAHATPTTTTCISSVNPSTLGEAVTFTATVSSAAGPPPDGDIVVFEPVGQAPTVNGVATYTTRILGSGSTKITAVFQGDLNFVTSSSVPFHQVVN